MSANKQATVRIALGTWDRLREDAYSVRHAVFVVEQKVPPEVELDDDDAVSVHAVAYGPDGTPMGTGRLLPDGHIGRMAVRKEARGTGVGARVLEALIDKAQSLGYPELILNAQTHAMPFYVRAGFTAEGEEFEEAGIPHIEMRRPLRSSFSSQ